MFRRVAAHHVHVNGNVIDRCVVEIEDGRVANYYTFTDELPLTEWLGGTITISYNDEGVLVAEWNGSKIE